MISFSSDADILKFEPVLFGELHFSWQVLTSGEGGSLAGTTFTKSGEDFVSAGVAAGGVIHLRGAEGSLDGAYEIVSVDSATELTVSVLRADKESDAIAPPSGTDIAYRISTFGPQANEAFFQLTQYFGIKPGDADSDYDADDILEPEALRDVSVFLVIASVYATLAGRAGLEAGFWKKSLYYQQRYEKARERTRVSIDMGSDGISDLVKSGGSMHLVRD